MFAEGLKMFRCSWQEESVNVLLSGQPSPTAWGAFVELMDLIGVEDPSAVDELVSAWANCAEYLAGGDLKAWERVTPDMDFERGVLILERVGG
jgi:hypothetical protein